MTDIFSDLDATTDIRADRLAAFRAYIDFLDEHPEAEVDLPTRIVHYVNTRDELVAVARALGGKWDKSTADGWFAMTQALPFGGMQYYLYTSRENVCTRVVVGTEKVLAPDPAALASLPRVEQVQEIVEWRCPPSLLGAS